MESGINMSIRYLETIAQSRRILSAFEPALYLGYLICSRCLLSSRLNVQWLMQVSQSSEEYPSGDFAELKKGRGFC